MLKRKRSSSRDIINPLSQNETTIKQLQVAGLTENDLLPSTYIPGFPHRSIRPSHLAQQQVDNDNDDNDDEDNDNDNGNKNGGNVQGTTHQSSPAKRKADRRRHSAAQRSRDAQDQHLGVLVAVILRSLDHNDIKRANRAFGLLWRTRVRGKPVDLRRQGLWTLGAEILMRQGEDDDDEKEQGEQAAAMSSPRPPRRPRQRWGATSNMPQLRAYLESLIRQHPYNRLHPNSISDLDFYPVLFGCEVYDVWVEHKGAWERLEAEAETWSSDDDLEDVETMAFAPEAAEDDDPSGDHDEMLRLPARERRLDEGKARLRSQALATMCGLAARMDALMENAPYNRSVELLRLRGMVALYVGDLSMPQKEVRDEERERAKALFIRMKEQSGGWADERVQRWIQEEDGDSAKVEDSDDGFSSACSGLPVFSSLPMR